jgi:DNA-directed RNA polymerase subunit RPC12/RpoP
MSAYLPNSTPELKHSFARTGKYDVHLVHGVACPYCARVLHASDVEVDQRGDTWLICAGCHRDVLKIEETL